jgi:hypothetical protein
LARASADFPEVRILREALEGVISPGLVTPVLFEALEPYGTLLPAGAEGLLEMVRGSLADVVARRVGHAEAGAVVQRVEQMLRMSMTTALGESAPEPAAAPAPRSGRERDNTALVPLAREAVSVLVIATGAGFATRLGAVLGEHWVAPFVDNSAQSIRARLLAHTSPDVVLVDATDFPPVTPDELAAAMTAGPPTVARALWGVDLPYGRSLSVAAAAAGLPLIAIERAHGVEPLLDLIRSRRRRA